MSDSSLWAFSKPS